MLKGVQEFDKALLKAQGKFLIAFTDWHRNMSLAVFETVIERSPIWTGRFRASNRIAVGSADESVHPGLPNPPEWPQQPGNVIARPRPSAARARLAQLKPFQMIVVSNNLSYAQELENGSSRQAPSGVYEIAVQIVDRKFQNAQMGPIEPGTRFVSAQPRDEFGKRLPSLDEL